MIKLNVNLAFYSLNVAQHGNPGLRARARAPNLESAIFLRVLEWAGLQAYKRWPKQAVVHTSLLRSI